jgi:hypothetical protein
MTRLNFTGRVLIRRSKVRLRLRTVGGEPVFDVLHLDLQDLTLPAAGEVIVEAYGRSKFTRFSAGTVGSIDLLSGQPLTEFEAVESPLFRVKVVGVGEHSGKLLAVADQLRAKREDEGPQSSLLSIAGAQLGQCLWELDFRDDDPQLLVNSSIGDWKNFAASPMFAALVLPEVLTQVIRWAVGDLGAVGEGDETPRALWVSFITDGLGTDPREADLSDEDDKENFVDDAVKRFCERHRFLDNILQEVGGIEA